MCLHVCGMEAAHAACDCGSMPRPEPMMGWQHGPKHLCIHRPSGKIAIKVCSFSICCPYLYIYTCVCVCMYECVWVVYVHVYAHIHVYVYHVMYCMYMCIRRMYVSLYMYKRLCVYTCVCMPFTVLQLTP